MGSAREDGQLPPTGDWVNVDLGATRTLTAITIAAESADG